MYESDFHKVASLLNGPSGYRSKYSSNNFNAEIKVSNLAKPSLGSLGVKTEINNLEKKVKNILVTDDTRLAAAKIAKDFFPYQPKYISAVTGTNGKTSVVNFVYEIWKKNNIDIHHKWIPMYWPLH